MHFKYVATLPRGIPTGLSWIILGTRSPDAFFCAIHSIKSANLFNVSPTLRGARTPCTRRPWTLPPTMLAPLLCHREHGHVAARCLRIIVLIVKFRSSAFVVRTLGVKPFSFSASPSRRSLPFLLQDWLHGFRGLFTDTSEHIRFYFLVFLFSTFSLSVSVR